ncbi:hypothetical protein FOZG_17368 [Fusarium oxysporum Fo47]|uniref:Carboxylesterase type B domain-containing protein n=1 Tax=Fusarium oxysporum Fo47 TaxID=660027 RepID=W9JGY2_FUSOX|nr:hypothetical protein FOZG_17368 [Fusarium oxysporum Fo47]
MLIITVITITLAIWGFPASHAHTLNRPASSPPTASILNGIILGTTTRVPTAPTPVVNQYLGVPFAKSPPERFLPPEDPEPWTSIWNATYYRPSCIQHFANDVFRKIFNSDQPPESEDCLHLNIFTPSTATECGRPVMVWIHGGSFQLGSARLSEYDGSFLAAKHGVVVVTMNYRTNVFGFPASPEIPLHQRNLGFMDQRKALAWVSRNIGAFGGDPSKVTIFGESVGGYSVKQLLINPPRPLPFRAAIIQSQAFGPAGGGEASWATLVKELECNATTAAQQLACVLDAPAEAIRNILDYRGLSFTPVVDNITNGPFLNDAFYQGSIAEVPILIGTNADEGTVLTSVMPPPEQMLGAIFGNNTASKELARLHYPSNATVAELQSRILTDYSYTCTTSAIAELLAHGYQNVWRYFFNATFPNNAPFKGAGAWHTSEIPLVFGTYRVDNETTAAQVRLSDSMQSAWAGFAKHPEDGPGWPMVGSQDKDLQLFDTNYAVRGRTIDRNLVDTACSYYDVSVQLNGL